MNEQPALKTIAESNLDRDWLVDFSTAIRDADALIDELRLPEELRTPARRAARLFPVVVPRSFLARMESGNPHDPLLKQVLPWDAEWDEVPGYTSDPLQELTARRTAGLLHKYAGRALLITTGVCAVHCRYCFRRHYPYSAEPSGLDDWTPALSAIAGDDSIQEVLLSGGDPLMLSDRRLAELCGALDRIPHVRRLRVHTRLPIVLPSRVNESLLDWMRDTRLQCITVVHANHPREIAGDCAAALTRLVQGGQPVLNQSVLLKGVNDNIEALADLSERLIDLGVMPYYLHQTDRVAGTAHFTVDEQRGRRLIEELRRRLPGYAVPRFVREVPGKPHKIPIGECSSC